MSTALQPTMFGHIVHFEGEEDENGMIPGMITDETEHDIFIEHPFFTGWMPKSDYFERLGVEE